MHNLANMSRKNYNPPSSSIYDYFHGKINVFYKKNKKQMVAYSSIQNQPLTNNSHHFNI